MAWEKLSRVTGKSRRLILKCTSVDEYPFYKCICKVCLFFFFFYTNCDYPRLAGFNFFFLNVHWCFSCMSV